MDITLTLMDLAVSTAIYNTLGVLQLLPITKLEKHTPNTKHAQIIQYKSF